MKITYLTPIKVGNPPVRVVTNPPVRVVTEYVEDILSLKRCGLYLQLWYEDLYSEENVKKCYNIFRLVTQKASDYHFDFDKKGDCAEFFCDNFYEKPGTSKTKRKKILLILFENSRLKFLCFEPDDSHGLTEYSSDVPIFELKDLLTDDNKYKTFLDYWENLENYETKRNILSQVLCKDVVDKILTMY